MFRKPPTPPHPSRNSRRKRQKQGCGVFHLFLSARPCFGKLSTGVGANTLITDLQGQPYQFFLNLPYGETMIEQANITDYENPFKFNGKELDAETGLYYYGARYYDPKISQWLGVDPLAEQGKRWSPYIYTFNNPIRFIDPSGMWPWPNTSATKAV